MTALPLNQGAYEARNVIANAQSAINIYPENNPPDAPFPVTHYPAPGLLLGQDLSASYPGWVRGMYQTSTGYIVFVIGLNVLVYTGAAPTLLGQLLIDSERPVSMCDNGTTLVLVDGSNTGYQCPLASLNVPGSLTIINDPAFFGSTRVDYIDTFLVFNVPGTGTFYTTTSGVVTPFDPTYAAPKEGWNDQLACCACLHDNIWLFGWVTTEVWFNAGGTAFPFARMPNSVIQQGCVAPYSVVIADNAVYWLSQDRWGRNMMMRGEGYSAKRVSTFAVEDAWSQYSQISDVVGMAYQIGGHETIGFYFPTGQAWWAYDTSTQMWHTRTYSDLSTPWLPYCMAGAGVNAYDSTQQTIFVGDRTGGRIYELSRSAYTDGGIPIQRQRSWKHVQAEGNRAVHARFWANFNGAAMNPDTLTLSFSDNGGNTYGTGIPQTCNNDPNGNYQWRRLGYARDRVYQLNWSGQGEFALNGAWIDVIPQAT